MQAIGRTSSRAFLLASLLACAIALTGFPVSAQDAPPADAPAAETPAMEAPDGGDAPMEGAAMEEAPMAEPPAAEPTPAPEAPIGTPPTPITGKGKVRGIWVDMEGQEVYNSEAAIRSIVQTIGDARFTDVYLIVSRGGAAMYPSAILPSSAALLPTLSDPVAAFIDAAKSYRNRGTDDAAPLRVHLALLPLEAYRGKTLDAAASSNVLRRNPGWALVNRAGQSRQFGDIHSLDPASPEARAYCATIVDELLKRYPSADGVQFHMVRYPGEDADWGYGQSTLAAYRRETGATGTPSNRSEDFRDWRREQLNKTARALADAARKAAPNAVVGFTCLATGEAPAGERGWARSVPREGALQDWVSWAQAGFADQMVLLDSFSEKYDPGQYDAWREFALRSAPDGKLVVGLGEAENFAEDVLSQVRRGLGSGAIGVALYSYQEPNIENIRAPLFSALANGLFSEDGTKVFTPSNIGVDPEFADLVERYQGPGSFERPDLGDIEASEAERMAIFGGPAPEDEPMASGSDKPAMAANPATPLLPDEIALRNGEILRGRIVNEAPGAVLVRLENGFEVNVQRTEIMEIRRAQR